MAKPDAIQPVNPWKSKHIFMIVYGNPGVGKTRLVGTGGARTLIVRPPMDHTDSIRDEGAEEWVVRGWNDMNEVEEFLRHEGAKHYDWVWLDSISLFQDTGLDEIWADLIAAKPHRAQYGLDKGEYGQNMTRLARWVRSIVGLDELNVGVTAHPAELAGPDDEMILMPYVQGKNMSNKVCGYMKLVAYLEVVKQKGKTVRVLRTNATDTYYAKDQFDAFGEHGRMVNPTMPKIIEAIEATRPKKTTAKKTSTRRRTTARSK